MKWLFAIFVVAVAAMFGYFLSDQSCSDSDKDCIRHKIETHEIRSWEFWESYFSNDLDNRVQHIPQAMVDYISLDNRLNDFDYQPKPALGDGEFAALVRKVLVELPIPLKSKLISRLAGIFLVRNLGGTGYTDTIYDGQGVAVGGFIVLDVTALDRTANEWATWKESSPFLTEEGFTLTAKIVESNRNTNLIAVRYILLHEIGHVLSITGKFHPSWNQEWAKTNPKDYPFANLSWQSSKAKPHSKFDAQFSNRAKVRYYFGPQLGASDAMDVYSALMKTNFPTLYAATSPYDDFAESFANFVHVTVFGDPFEISIADKQSGKRLRFNHCWGQKRCMEKERLLRQYLEP